MTNKEIGAKLDKVIELLEKIAANQGSNYIVMEPTQQNGALASWDCSCPPGAACMNTHCPRAYRSNFPYVKSNALNNSAFGTASTDLKTTS